MHQWLLSFHIISMTCWFAGLFYLPRLFVYHARAQSDDVQAQLKVMERRLYYYIMTPAMVLTVIFGLCLWLPHYHFYAHAMWLHIKLILVLTLLIYHGYCGKLLNKFKNDQNTLSDKFYRFFNEYPTLVLISVVLLTVIKP